MSSASERIFFMEICLGFTLISSSFDDKDDTTWQDTDEEEEDIESKHRDIFFLLL